MLLEAYIRWRLGNGLMREWRIPLLNAVSHGRLGYGRTLHVRKATSQELSRWSANDLIRDVVPHRVLPQIQSVLVYRSRRAAAADDLDRELMVWFAGASLFAGPSRLVEAAFVEQWHRGPKDRGSRGHLIDTRIFPLSLPVPSAAPWRGAINLDTGRRSVVRALRAFRSNHRYLKQFHFALSRWFYSLNKERRTIEDAVLDLTIALESVFILQDECGDKGELLRERVAAFWFETEPTASTKRRKSFKWKLHEAYSVRSRVVHGDIVDAEKLNVTRNLFDQIMRELLHDFIAGYLAKFDPLGYRSPSGEEAQKPHDSLRSDRAV